MGLSTLQLFIESNVIYFVQNKLFTNIPMFPSEDGSGGSTTAGDVALKFVVQDFTPRVPCTTEYANVEPSFSVPVTIVCGNVNNAKSYCAVSIINLAQLH